MTYYNEIASIYSGTPKLVIIGLDGAQSGQISSDTLHATFTARGGNDDGVVIEGGDGKIELSAPLAGITVLCCTQQTTALADRLAAFWSDAGLSAPPIVVLAEKLTKAGLTQARTDLSGAFAQAAMAAYAEVCGEATTLDRQIAALREQLEDSRNKWQDCSAALKSATHGLPVLGYWTRHFSGSQRLRSGELISQQLPYSSIYCKAAGIHIAKPAGDAGRLECRLVALEDDVVLAHWGSLPVAREGWCVLSMPDNIPWRYRNLHLVFLWDGSEEHAPELSLCKAAGMDRYFMHINEMPQDGIRLALQAWAGHPDTPSFGTAIEPNSLWPHAGREYGIYIGRGVLEQHEKLVDRNLGEWPWVTVADNGVMVHPTLDGPSVISLTLDSPFPIQGAQVLCEASHPAGPPIEFLVAAFADGTAPGFDKTDPEPDLSLNALASEGWHAVAPGTGLPLVVQFEARKGPIRLVLATRVKGSSIISAHGWFRDLRLRCAV